MCTRPMASYEAKTDCPSIFVSKVILSRFLVQYVVRSLVYSSRAQVQVHTLIKFKFNHFNVVHFQKTITMTTTSDMCRTVSSQVHTCAQHVTSVPSCRSFSDLFGRPLCNGTVTNVGTVEVSNRNWSMITCFFELPGQTTQCTLHLCNAKEGNCVDEKEI